MTEDEAFIRRIVDGPGDDTARLVYADWLDDRDDPRGAYLRAEHEWAKAGKKEKALHELAAGLDPVWVARLSRPPVGVCCDELTFLDAGPPLTSADINEAEKRMGIEVTGAYRAFLLNYNGGTPRPRRADTLKEWHKWHSLNYQDWFLSVLSSSREHEQRSLVHQAAQFRSIVPELANVELWDAQPEDVPWQADVIPLDERGSYFQLFYAVRGRYEGLLHLHDWTGEWCRFGYPSGPHEPPTLPEFLHHLANEGLTFVDTYPGQPLQEFWKS